MITSDLEELNIDQLTDYEGEPSYMLTENPKKIWKKVVFDPEESVTEASSVLSFHENRIVSTVVETPSQNIDLTGAITGSGVTGTTIETDLSSTIDINDSLQVFDLKSSDDTTFEYRIEQASAGAFEEKVSKDESWTSIVHDFETSTPTFYLESSDAASFNWPLPVNISPGDIDSYGPTVTCDSQGNAFVIWHEIHASSSIITVARYDAETKSWSPSIELTPRGQSAYQPDIKMNASGDAIAVWSKFSGGNYIIQSASYDPVGESWSSAVTVAGGGQNGFNPNVAIDANGNAIAAWYADIGNSVIQAAAYDGSLNTWSAHVNLSAPGENGSFPKVGMDGSGNGLALWSHHNGSKDIIQNSRYDGVLKTWSTTVDVSLGVESDTSPSLSVIPSGDAMAVWQKRSGSQYIVEASRYDAVTLSWETPVAISTFEDQPLSPSVSMNASENALTIWFARNNIDNVGLIQSSTYDPITKTWAAPYEISSGLHASIPEIDIDDEGNGVAIWAFDITSTPRIQASTYEGEGKIWSTPIYLSTQGQSSYSPQVCMNKDQPIAAWSNHSGVVARVQVSVADLSHQIFSASDSAFSFFSRPLKNVAEPVDGSDAATKNYVDTQIAMLMSSNKSPKNTKPKSKIKKDKKSGFFKKLFSKKQYQ